MKKLNKSQMKLEGKCGKYDFTLSVAFSAFPSSKERDKAYRVWAETFVEGKKKRRKV